MGFKKVENVLHANMNLRTLSSHRAKVLLNGDKEETVSVSPNGSLVTDECIEPEFISFEGSEVESILRKPQ